MTNWGLTLIRIKGAQAGRLQHFIKNWKRVTEDQWVLNTVRGYQV